MKIPFLDLTRQYRKIKKEIDEALMRVIESGRYIGGEDVKGIEEEIAEYTSVKYGVSTSSGTDALLATLMSIGIKEGDEVITTPFTFIASAEVISFLNAKPVFVDIDEKTFNINPDLIESKITERTKCIIPVHLFGDIAAMELINVIAKSHNIKVVEDSCQAAGASLNGKMACSFGDAGCLSFFPSKNLGAFGDGGMILTNSKEIADRVRIIKDHGSVKLYHNSVLGFNGRLDAIQAAILRVKLKHLDEWNEKRRNNAYYYNDMLKSYVKVPLSDDCHYHIYHQYSIITDKRDELIDFLKKRDIPTAVYYPIPLHMQEVFGYLGYKEGDFPVAEKVSNHILSLPIFPELEAEEIQYIADSVIEFFSIRT